MPGSFDGQVWLPWLGTATNSNTPFHAKMRISSLQLRTSEIVEKTRHYVTTAELTWEVDEFSGSNSGLVIAEVELVDEGIDIQLPDWVGEEVTGQKMYHNSQSRHSTIQ